MRPDRAAVDLPDYDTLDALVDEDPIALRDVAWQLRAQVATLTAEKEEFAANYRAIAAERDTAVVELAELKGKRILSVVFGHHKGAPRPFALRRREDVSGVSGTGVVALGAEWPDGLVVLRWTSDWPTSVVFHDRGIESVEAIHGHGGKTEVVWLSDEIADLAEMEQERDAARAELAERTRERDALLDVASDSERGACQHDPCDCTAFEPSGEFDLASDDRVCTCGDLEREHDHPAGPLSASERAEQPDTGARGTDTAQGRTGHVIAMTDLADQWRVAYAAAAGLESVPGSPSPGAETGTGALEAAIEAARKAAASLVVTGEGE